MTEFSRKFPSCQRFSRGTISTAPHTTQLRQNAAAKATWTGRMGIKTLEKAGSVSKETQPRAPEIDTTAPKSRSPPLKDAARPINVKPANISTHQRNVASVPPNPNTQAIGVPPNPNSQAISSKAPKQPDTNPTIPAELAKSVCVASGSRA